MAGKDKKYDFTRKPKKPNRALIGIYKRYAPNLRGKKVTISRIGMENIKPPYLILPTRTGAIDFAVARRALSPNLFYSVVSLDAVQERRDALMRRLGCVAEGDEKSLAENLLYCAKQDKHSILLASRSRYSLDGRAQEPPKELFALAKKLNLPLVVLRMHGNFLFSSPWNREEKKTPVFAELELVATAEQIGGMDGEDFFALVKEKSKTDDYAYQRARGIEIDNPRRAKGLHNILYRCPHCLAEHITYSEGVRIWCASCGKGWQMSELGEIVAEEGETEFSSVPAWVDWEKGKIRERFQNNAFLYQSEVTVYSLRSASRFLKFGKGKLIQTPQGTTLEYSVNGSPKKLVWGGEINCVHVGFGDAGDRRKRGKHSFGDYIDLTAEGELLRLSFTGRDRAAKAAFALAEIARFQNQK